MKNSRDTTSGRPDAHSLEKPQEAPGSGPGWIRTSDTQNDDSGLGEPRGANESVGDGGSQPPEPVVLLPQLSLEDRLVVALAGRGAQTIDGFIRSAKAAAWEAMDRRPPKWDLNAWPDEALVEAVEQHGDALGLPAAERQGVSGVDAVLHRERRAVK